MSFKKYLLLLIASLLALPATVMASHLYGADFSYQSLGGLSYKLTLAVYGDCSGSAFMNLPTSQPEIELFNDAVSTGNVVANYNLTINAPTAGVNVTPVCAAQVNNTTCNNGTIPGVKRFIYTKTITLPSTSAKWRFKFTGTMGNTSSAGRSNSIGNIVFANMGGSVMVLEATLNNTNGANSSPQFTTIPTPFYCVNVAQQYNQGAVDPDGDLLIYELAPALEGTGTVTYAPGYSAIAPLATSAPISFDTTTGQLAFISGTVQKSIVVNKVKEYRNGVLIGTAMREMTFIVLGSCNSAPPVGPVDTAANTFTGGVATSGTDFNSCYGTASLVHFNINPTDPDADTVNVTVNGLPTGATATITGNNTIAPMVSFNWNTTAVPVGNYTFFITYKDFGCPLSNQQTIAYTVHIIRPNELTSAIVVAPTQCAHRATIKYALNYGLAPRIMTITQGGNLVHTINDQTGSLTDSLFAGIYNISIASPGLDCISQYTITVVDSGVYPYKPLVAPVFYCENDTPVALTATPGTGASLLWYDPAGAFVPSAPVPSTVTPGITNYLVSQKYLVCESLKDTAKVYVTARPIAAITAPASVCTKDTALVNFSGTIGVGPIIAYNWTFENPDFQHGSGAGPYLLNWQTPGPKTITLQVFENQCPSFPDTISIIVKPTPKSVFTVPAEACRLDTIQAIYRVQGLAGEQYTWGFDGAIVVSGSGRGSYNITYTDPGLKHVTMLVDLNGCIDTSGNDVLIHPTPDTRILNQPGTVCLADKIYLQATGGVTFTWTPDERIFHEPDGTIFTRVMVPTTYTVYARSEFGCADSAKITYDKIEPCCTFSYPTAFTPNGDGHNDKFKPITYGNEQAYELSIYDRWGHRVFYTFDQTLGWDGTYGGKLCESGTYFYFLKARCYTGHDEMTKGDFELLR